MLAEILYTEQVGNGQSLELSGVSEEGLDVKAGSGHPL